LSPITIRLDAQFGTPYPRSAGFDTDSAITNMKARLGSLEMEIESAGACDKLLMMDLSKCRTLQKDTEQKLENQIQQRDIWIKNLVDIAECLTAHVAKTNMKSWAFTVSNHEVPSVKLTLFFEGLIEGLKMYEEDRATCFAEESWKLARDTLFLVLSNLAFLHPDLNLPDGFKKLLPGADTSTAVEKVAPLAENVLSIPRVPEGHHAHP